MRVIFYSDNLNIEIIDIFRLYRKKSRYHTPKRPFHILTKRISGYTDMRFENAFFTAGEGNLLYIPANTEYTRQSYENEEIIAIHLNILNKDISEPAMIDVDSAECNEVFFKLYEIWSERKKGYKYRCTAILYRYLSDIVIEKIRSKEYSRIERSVKHIENNFTEKLQIEDLAKLCNMCETQYRKLFKKEFGISPVKYINRLRISRAVSMMYSGYYSMSEISELCGFSDQKYFNKIFKSETGKSPSQYRRDYFFELKNERSQS